MRYTYLQSQTEDDSCGEMWTAGYFDADGEWHGESDWATAGQAADRAELLNRDPIAAERALIRPGHPIADVMMS
jgi:hypothetical protein